MPSARSETLCGALADLRGSCFLPEAYGIEGQPGGPVVSGNESGLIPMCVERIFKRVTSDMMVTMSVFEIYQEKVRDLLAQSTDQQHAGAGPGGGGRRGIGSGSQPAMLDRDGGFRDLKMLEDSLGQKKVVPMGRIMLVDLAGLEDNRVTGNVGGALRESTAINTSHFALARMLWALKKNRNVPYRNSKLTRLFQNSMEPSIPLPIDYKTISIEDCEGIREEAETAAAAARDREMIDVDDDDDDVDAMSVTYDGSDDPNPSGFLSPHDEQLHIDARPSLHKEERSMCATVEEDESLRDVDIRDECTDTDCAEPVRPSPKKRSRLEGSSALRASAAQLMLNQDVTPKAKNSVPSGAVTRSMAQNMKGMAGAAGGGRSRSLNPAPTRRGAAARRLAGTRSVADIQADRTAAEMETVVKSAVASIVQSIRSKAIEMIEQELLPTIETMAETGIREALAVSNLDGRRTRSSEAPPGTGSGSLDIVVESPMSQHKD
ncbi:Kinesin-like protein kif22 [Perkinsus olseni]|uniref:Kinesin-like protein kif22 n=1 Tax=Perkinsus olseni TaxID=32597 RepID=A0A7J6M967_PEROL|nr:Kinesin-like protein kif22 [Perkinsus olseni]